MMKILSLKWYHMIIIMLLTLVATYFVSNVLCGIYAVLVMMSSLYWISKFKVAKQQFIQHPDSFRSTTCEFNNEDSKNINKDI